MSGRRFAVEHADAPRAFGLLRATRRAAMLRC